MSFEKMTMVEKLKRLAELDAAAVEQGRLGGKLGVELGVEVTNDRGKRELLWLVESAGRQAIAEAAEACLTSGQHAFPLNISRRLRLQLRPPAGPAVLAALLRAQLRSAATAAERERQAEYDAAARRATRAAGGAA